MLPSRPPIALLLFVVVAGSCPTARAAVRISARSGPWKRPSTWIGGAPPAAADEVVISSGHRVEYSGPDNPSPECARLTIEVGGELTFKERVTEFQVGGNGPGVRGGIEIWGRLTVPGGVAVSLYPDGNSTAEEDGVVVKPGGTLDLLGQVLYQGTVGSVVADDDRSDIVFIDPSLRLRSDVSSLRVVWRSGPRKGRWYPIRSVSGSTLSLDFSGRSNAERWGEPDYRIGTASVAGSQVTGNGTQWTEAVAEGSRWWCEGDPPEAAVRVRRVDGPGSLQLAQPYGGSGCSQMGAYTLRDDNQPYPAVDVSERIRPGDAYSVVMPAVLRSGAATDADFDDQIFVQVEPGASFHFRNAVFESVGKEAWQPGRGSGVEIRGFTGAPPSEGVIDTVEIYRYAGEAGLELIDCRNLDVDWLFLHWAHPRITLPNEGHGVKIRHTSPGLSADNVRIRNARFDRTNDDFVWWASRAGGSSGVYDSIGKFCPNTASGDSCDGVDTNDELGGTGGQLRIERNLFANIGAVHDGSCLSAAIGSGIPLPAWEGEGWLARDNVCLNLQSVSCLITIGDTRDWTNERIWAVNNVCASVFGNGLVGIPRAFQNQVIDFGLVHRNVADGLRNVYEARGNIVRGAGDLRDGESFLPRGVAVGVGLGSQENWSGLSWILSDNLMIVSGLGSSVASWSSGDFPAVGDARVAHNFWIRDPRAPPEIPAVGFLDVHYEPVAYRVILTDNLFEGLGSSVFLAGQGMNQASADLVDHNVVSVVPRPPWIGDLVPTNDSLVPTGVTAANLDFGIKAGSGAWSAPTTDGDRPGPRFAGCLVSRLPFVFPGLIPAVDPGGEDRDTDGDGLIDRWDNCPTAPNPGWADADRNGIGDLCQP